MTDPLCRSAPRAAVPEAGVPQAGVVRLLATIALLLLVPSLAGAEPEPAPVRTKLVFHADAELTELGSLGEQDFRLTLEVENPTDATIAIEAANLLLAHQGGWLIPLDPDPMDGSFFRGDWDVPDGERHSVGRLRYRSLSPATHALLSVRAADGEGHSGAVSRWRSSMDGVCGSGSGCGV